jgi:hypothetical protein
MKNKGTTPIPIEYVILFFEVIVLFVLSYELYILYNQEKQTDDSKLFIYMLTGAVFLILFTILRKLLR